MRTDSESSSIKISFELLRPYIYFITLVSLPFFVGVSITQFTMEGLFYVIYGDVLLPLFNPAEIAHVILIGIPSLFYLNKVRQHGRRPGSFRRLIQCAIATLAIGIVLFIIFPLPPRTGSGVSILFIDLDYIVIFLFFALIYPEIRYQFNWLRSRELGQSKKVTRDDIFSQLRNRITLGDAIILSLFLTSISAYHLPADPTDFFQVFWIFTPVVLFYTAFEEYRDLSLFLSGPFSYQLLIIWTLLFLFMILLVRYTLTLTSKRKLLIFAIISLVVTYIAVPPSHYFQVLIFPTVYVISWLLLKTNYISVRPYEPIVEPEPQEVPASPISLYVRVPLTYLIKSRLRRFIKRG